MDDYVSEDTTVRFAMWQSERSEFREVLDSIPLNKTTPSSNAPSWLKTDVDKGTFKELKMTRSAPQAGKAEACGAAGMTRRTRPAFREWWRLAYKRRRILFGESIHEAPYRRSKNFSIITTISHAPRR